MGSRARVSIDARARARARRGETGGGGRPPGARGAFFFLLAPRRVGGAVPHERVASRDEARRGDEAPVARIGGEGSEDRVDARSTRVGGPGWFVAPVVARVSTGGSEAEDRALERGDVDVSGRRRALFPERGAERLERARSFAAAREGAVAIVRARERGRERRGRARPGRARERTRGVGRSGGRRATRGRGELEGEAAPPGRGRGEPSRQPPRGGRGGRGGRAGSGGARRARRDAARGRRVPAPHRDRPRGRRCDHGARRRFALTESPGEPLESKRHRCKLL